MRKLQAAAAALIACGAIAAIAGASTPGKDVRLTNDAPNRSGYVSAFTLATGRPYTDGVLRECSISRGRQNEPYVAVNPRDPRVVIGSANDYCGVYGPPGDAATGNPAGPIWLGYYRSQNGGASFRSSLVPGYPADTSPFRALSEARTASAGDPVIAWDRHGRVFLGAESSDDPAGTLKTFGDVWVARYVNSGGGTINDGKRYAGTAIVARGSSAPFLLGKFNDKTAIEVDRTGGRNDGNVYFSWSRFTGNADSNIYFARSTDHGRTFSKPMLLTQSVRDVQNPDIAITGNGNVYVTFDSSEDENGQPAGNWIVKSTDGGQTFTRPRLVDAYLPYEATDLDVFGGRQRDCGDAPPCQAGYTFFRNDTSTRAAADQRDAAHEFVWLIYNPIRPGTIVDTGTTYGSFGLGRGGQATTYVVRYNGATGTHTAPRLLAPTARGHRAYPDIAIEGGVLHAIWWDSRNDPAYSVRRPIGNTATGVTVPSLDTFATRSTDGGASWTTPVRLSDVTTNPNYEQFSDRTVPFAGDYLSVTALGSYAFATWTDWRNTVPGSDPREGGDGDDDNADVKQCRRPDGAGGFGPDLCPHAGGLDQNIYGDLAP